MYKAYIVELKGEEAKIHDLNIERSKQVRIQFLYREKDDGQLDKFLLLIHQECEKLHVLYINITHRLQLELFYFLGVLIYTVSFDISAVDFRMIKELKSESLMKAFMWAQWDMVNQVLYHIHHRRIPVSLVSEDEDEKETKSTRSNPTLSGLQFHDDLPHETVVNKLFTRHTIYTYTIHFKHFFFFFS